MALTLAQLNKLMKAGESETVEFKTSTGQLREAVMTLCAFLNHRGGTVIIGAKQKGELVGQDVTDATRQEIARELAKIEPASHTAIQVSYVLLPNRRHVIVLQVGAGSHAPYVYDGRPYQRIQSSTSKMAQQHYEQLLVERKQFEYIWEEVLVPGYTVDKLDHEEIHRTIADGVQANRIPADALKDTPPQILKRLQLMSDHQIKRAAIVLFAKEEYLDFPQCMMKMARFKGRDKLGDFIDNQQVYGHAFKLLQEADVFLRRHLPIASVFKPDQFKRIDKPALPVLAVREALINAICHRDYSNRSASISLAIFDDRLEIWNNGALPSELKLADLKRTHDSLPRNKLIAKVFYTRDLIETWGTGTNKMIQLCQEEGLPEPQFELRTGGLAVTFLFKETLEKGKEQPGVLRGEHANVNLTPRQSEILRILTKGNELSAADIRQRLQEPPAERTLRDDLAFLKKEGWIVSRGRGSHAVWIKREKEGE